MISMITPEKLKDSSYTNDISDHLAYALQYMFRNIKQHSYACECKHCEITLYTSTKRLNCEYCGSSDPEVFTCTELK